jgi:hypothetical protein
MHRVIQCEPARYDPHRYLLVVHLAGTADDAGAADNAGPRMTAILKNPSTASAMRSDPTIGKVAAWACRNGFASVAVVNLFALRATRPSALNACPYDHAVGPDNDAHILDAIATADAVVLGWGDPNGLDPTRYDRRIADVLRLLGGRSLTHIGPLTHRGYPRHGLLWNGDCVRCDWPAAGER